MRLKRWAIALWNARTKEWAPLLAFVFLAFVGGYAIQQSANRDAELLHDGLIQACERANHRDRAANIRTEVMRKVLLAAAESREKEALIAKSEEEARVNIEVAERYRELVKTLPVARPLDCEVVVPRP